MADRSSLLVSGLHAVSIRSFVVSSGLGSRKCRKTAERSGYRFTVGLGLTHECFFLFIYYFFLGGGTTLSAWISVQCVRGSAFYDLTVAKERGPYAGN